MSKLLRIHPQGLLLFLPLFLLHGFKASSEPGPRTPTRSPGDTALFEELSPDETGLDFFNTLPEETEGRSIFSFNYLYNGAGVAAGDINNDGLLDLYFVGNAVPDRLYVNEGNFRFRDITRQAGLKQEKDWRSGVQMVDLNSDGYEDIYVTRGGWREPDEMRRNLLYVNQGDGTFREEATKWGIDDPGFGLDTSFFDMDRDGDLDLYIANRPRDFFLSPEKTIEFIRETPEHSRDRLYRNEGNFTFTEITAAAGIDANFGYGLSVTTADLNGDGWVDIYVANDFIEHDYCYLNQGNGTFRQGIKELFGHVSLFAMGTDVADINNDGLEDLLNVEMLPEDYKRSKTSMADMNTDVYYRLLEEGRHHQYMHNMMQINRGNGHFSEVAQLSGLQETDWSWACLLEDFDNDGDRDVFVANGYKRDLYDQDASSQGKALRARTPGGRYLVEEMLNLFTGNDQLNYLFENLGDLRFVKRSSEWGLETKTFSNGAIAADLDRDGDLDIVCNDIDGNASVYRNHASENGNQYVQVQLTGPKGNPHGEGAIVKVVDTEGEQCFQMKRSRGYLSGLPGIAHFGLGTNTLRHIDVRWLDDKLSRVHDPGVNQLVRIRYDEATPGSDEQPPSPLFIDRSERIIPGYRHTENAFDDFQEQILLPHRLSRNGPALAVADVNEDGLDDFFVGGAQGRDGALYVQKNYAGRNLFVRVHRLFWATQAAYEDVRALFFDADGDNDQDLYVVSGGVEHELGNPLFQDRLYLNDGQGNFFHEAEALPPMPVSGGAVAAGDYDLDGDMDLFVGGRVIPNRYPYPPASFILRNDAGRFTDVSGELHEGFGALGMVTDALWADLDGAGQPELVITGEWMGIQVFSFRDGKLVDQTDALDLGHLQGWYFEIAAEDLDSDGDVDLIAGNMGLNQKFGASSEKPFEVYCDDFDQSGTYDIVLAKNADDGKLPVRGRQCSSDQMPFIGTKFPTFNMFADANLNDIFGEALDRALHLEARNFASMVLLNNGAGFDLSPLPTMAQLGPIHASVFADLNLDGRKDMIVAGALHHFERETTRADALLGQVLLQSDDGSFEEMPARTSGLYLSGDVKQMHWIRNGARLYLLVASNGAPLQLWEYSERETS